MSFVMDRDAILQHPRLKFLHDVVPVNEHLDNIEKFINVCYDNEDVPFGPVVQHGRVIALRATDEDRLSSAFKASVYLGKYNDMGNKDRFLKSMVSAGHSYEPIRGENILFLFIGVGKTIYDHLITYSVGRPTRIAGGQRANVPWGFELPAEAKNPDEFDDELDRIRNVIQLAKKDRKEQMQAARAKLPVGYIMPPFLLEFTEEALIKTVFRQRLFEKGAQGATVEIVSDMLECCLQIDPDKWNTLIEYHGPHIEQWQKTMRELRKDRPTFGILLSMLEEILQTEHGKYYDDAQINAFLQRDVYDTLIQLYGKMPTSMWEKNR